MPNVTDAIRNRRSVRRFSPKPVPKKTLQEILAAARWAPSSHNAQPWRFAVLTKTAEKEALAKAMAKAWIADLTKNNAPPEFADEMAKHSIQRFTTAPVIVIACVTMIEMPKHADDIGQEIERDLAIQSLGAAIQNMLLEAHANGFGACWWCAPAFCKRTVREVLRLPESYEPQALITVGYSDERPETSERKPFREIVRYGFCKKNLSD
jgi:coenzyme F420-0:L-glutamate ligase/coenzyme F420-1:gamma-L-glutamate ligase